jgi:hypothetical protein
MTSDPVTWTPTAELRLLNVPGYPVQVQQKWVAGGCVEWRFLPVVTRSTSQANR